MLPFLSRAIKVWHRAWQRHGTVRARRPSRSFSFPNIADLPPSLVMEHTYNNRKSLHITLPLPLLTYWIHDHHFHCKARDYSAIIRPNICPPTECMLQLRGPLPWIPVKCMMIEGELRIRSHNIPSTSNWNYYWGKCFIFHPYPSRSLFQSILHHMYIYIDWHHLNTDRSRKGCLNTHLQFKYFHEEKKKRTFYVCCYSCEYYW